ENKDDMLRPRQHVLRGSDVRRRRSALVVRLGAQQGKIERGDVYGLDRVPGPRRTISIGVGEGAAETRAGRVRMSLNDRDMLAHDAVLSKLILGKQGADAVDPDQSVAYQTAIICGGTAGFPKNR